MNESPFLQYKDVLVHDRRASARCLRSIVLSMRECSDCSVNADDLAQLTPEHFEAAQALLAVYKDGLANDRAAMEVLREVEKHWPDYRTAPYGLEPFPDPEMIFVPDQAELIEHLQPFFGIDLSTVNREWTGYLTMLGPLEPTEHESVGQATEGTPWHNRLVHTNWIGFKVENGRYRLMGDPRYFFLHAGNEHLADPYVEAREQLVEQYARQKTAYEAARAKYRETGLLFCPSDLAEGVPAHRVEQMAFVEQIGGVADFSKFPASSLTLGYEECGKSGITAGYPCSPAGRVFHHVASVPGYHYQSAGADRVMMFYEPAEGLVLFGFYRRRGDSEDGLSY